MFLTLKPASFPAPCGPASLKLAEGSGLRGRAGTFPAPCGPASLKPRAALDTPAGTPAPFPAPCGPASLKRCCLSHHSLSSLAFPAPCGPASLKLEAAAAREARLADVSGPLRAGLIEAAAAETAPALPPAFPAPCGPASLKPALLGDLPHRLGPFPAPCGPASLKQAGCASTLAFGCVVSGPLRAGLIEARRARWRP